MVRCYPAESAVAHAAMYEAGFAGSDTAEWRKAIIERIETVVLPALHAHYQKGEVCPPEFSLDEYLEWSRGEVIQLSSQLAVNFDLIRSPGMRPKNLGKTIADFFWYKLAMPGQVYTTESKNKKVAVSVMIEVPE